jgi:hypothetical protein
VLPQKVDPPCLPGVACKLPTPPNRCTIANNYCGPAPKPAPPKKPSRLQKCLDGAAQNYSDGVSFDGFDLAGRQAVRGGNALISNPMASGGLNGAEAAKAAAGIPFYNLGYYIARSCP